MIKFYPLILILLFSACTPKVQKEIVIKEEVKETKALPIKAKKVVFCARTFERVEKVKFLNDIYRAFHWGDSSLIEPYLAIPIDISVQNGSGGTNNYSNKTLSKESLKNWTNFLKEISTDFGTSVCVKNEMRSTEYAAETCLTDQGEKGKTYFKYVHFEVKKNKYELSGIGLVVF